VPNLQERRGKRRSKSNTVVRLQRVDDYVNIVSTFDREVITQVKKVSGREWRGQDKVWRVPVESFKELVYYLRDFKRELAPDLLSPFLYISERYSYQVRLHSLRKSVRERLQRQYGVDEFGICDPGEALEAVKDDSILCHDQRLIMDFVKLTKRLSGKVPDASGIIRGKSGVITGRGGQPFETRKLILRPYQYKPINIMLGFKRVIVGDEQGLGKSPMAVYAAARLFKMKRIKKVLVVCMSGKKYDWEDEFRKFTHLPVTVVDGLKLKRAEQWATADSIVVANYEQIAVDLSEIITRYWDVVIVDEVTKIKSWKSQRTKAFRKIESEYMWMLSGTIIENDLRELHNLVSILQPDRWEIFPIFAERYMKLDQWGRVLGYKNTDEIRARVQGLIVRRLRDDAEVVKGGLDRPVTFHESNPKIRLCPATQKIYDAIESDMKETALTVRHLSRDCAILGRGLDELDAQLLDAGDEVVRQKLSRRRSVMAKRLKGFKKDKQKLQSVVISLFTLLRQVSDSPFLLTDSDTKHAKKYAERFDSELAVAHSGKLHKLIDLLENEIPQSSKVLVFTCFERMQRWINLMLRTKGISHMIVNGSHSAYSKSARIKAFKRRKSIRVLVATDCISYGQNLQEVQYVVNFDLPFNPAVLSQRNMRPDRGIETIHDDIFIINLISDTSLELRILDVLRPKVDLSKQLLAERKRQSFGFRGVVKLLEI